MEEENSDLYPFSVANQANQTLNYQVHIKSYKYKVLIFFLFLGIIRYFFNKFRFKHNSTKSQS